MTKKIGLFSIVLLLAAATLPASGRAEVAWQARQTIKTATPPLSINVTADGQRTFILTEGGRLEIYDNNARIIDTIDVDPAMKLLSVDGAGGRVFLGNVKNSSVHELQIEYIADFDNTGSPFMGNSEAPVVLAFFSDFQ
jgi:hypothetical protein